MLDAVVIESDVSLGSSIVQVIIVISRTNPSFPLRFCAFPNVSGVAAHHVRRTEFFAFTFLFVVFWLYQSLLVLVFWKELLAHISE